MVCAHFQSQNIRVKYMTKKSRKTISWWFCVSGSMQCIVGLLVTWPLPENKIKMKVVALHCSCLMTLIGNTKLLIHHKGQLIYHIYVYNWLCICYEIPVVLQFHCRTHWIPVPFHWAPQLVSSDHTKTLFISLNIWVSPGPVVVHSCVFRGQKPYWTEPQTLGTESLREHTTTKKS